MAAFSAFAASAKLALAASFTVSKITAADTADAVEAAKTAGVTAIEGVHTPGNLDTVKEKALEAIQTASETKIASIDKNAKIVRR